MKEKSKQAGVKFFIKKVLAFILDIIILIILGSIIIYFIEMIVLGSLGIVFSNSTAEIKSFISIIEYYFRFLMVYLYFVYLPQRFGNTFGRKILKIQDKMAINILWPSHLFKNKHLKKDGILKVVSKDGQWVCPSCNEPSLEIYDVCHNCGQEVEKSDAGM